MKQTYTNSKSRMSSKRRFWTQFCVLAALLMGQCGSLWATGTIKVEGLDETSECPGNSVVLTATNMAFDPSTPTTAYAVNFYSAPVVTTGTPNWTLIATVKDPSGVFTTVADIQNIDLMFKAVASDSKKDETNWCKVTISTDCKESCHQSSSGEYINGTDFDIIGGSKVLPQYYSSSSVGEGKVEEYFSDYDVTFTASSNSNFAISNDFAKYMNGTLPSNSDGFSNYYYFVNFNDESAPFSYTFKFHDKTRTDKPCNVGNHTQNAVWDGKYYRIKMRMYVYKRSGNSCDCENMKLKLETLFGSQGNFLGNADHAEIYALYDETRDTVYSMTNCHTEYPGVCKQWCVDNGHCDDTKWGTITREDGTVASWATYKESFTDYSTGVAVPALRGECYPSYEVCDKQANLSTNTSFSDISLGSMFCNKRVDGKLMEVNINFYGKFTLTNMDETGTIKPRFQQWGDCFDIAVDFISVEQMDVCMDRSAACLGSTVTVNAAGFPYGSEYVWEYKGDDGAWHQLQISGFDWRGTNEKYKVATIPVEKIGKVQYRVYDSNTVGVSSEYIYFDINGKNCEPVLPSGIEGLDAFCIPNESMKFNVSPVDANENVSYHWSILDADKKVLTNSESMINYGPSSKRLVGTAREATKGDTVYVSMNSENKAGKYYIQVQTVRDVQQSSGEYYTESYGDVILDSFIVHKTPGLSLTLLAECSSGATGDDCDENAKTLCPTDRKQRVIAATDVLPKDGTKYIFTWTNATQYNVVGDTAIVNLPTAESCAGTLDSFYIGVKVQIENVGCPNEVGRKYHVSNPEPPTIDCDAFVDSLKYTLGATESTKTLSDFPMPSFTSGCEKDPDFSIAIKFTGADGKTYDKTYKSTKDSIADVIKNDPFTAPAGVGTITYTVTDGCGKSASCKKVLAIIDNTAPNIDCGLIPSQSGYVTKDCEATPGEGVIKVIETPVLTDKNGVDGDITGVYEGRVENPAVVPDPSSSENRKVFTKDKALNDPYIIGTTYILWSFTDASGNATFCTSTIEVIDSVLPEYTCPTVPDDWVIASVDTACGQSLNGLLSMVEAPSAVDKCSGDGTVLVPEVYYSYYDEVAGENVRNFVPATDYNKIIFDVDIQYTVEWVFKKKNNPAVAVRCSIDFTVADSTPPVIDCSVLQTVRVFANTYKADKQLPTYLDYASYDDVTEQGSIWTMPKTYTGTLKAAFGDGDESKSIIKFLKATDYKDNCEGNEVNLEVLLTYPDGTTYEPKSWADLKSLKYPIGLTTIKWKIDDGLQDDYGNPVNVDSCTQSIIVNAGTAPELYCGNSDTTIYVGDDCKALFEVNKADVPTDTVPVMRTTVYFNFREGMVDKDGNTVTESLMSNYFPNKISDLTTEDIVAGKKLTIGWLSEQFNTDYYNSSYLLYLLGDNVPQWDRTGSAIHEKLKSWSKLNTKKNNIKTSSKSAMSSSNSLTTNYRAEGFPYDAVLYDENGVEIARMENKLDANDSVATRFIEPRYIDSHGTATQYQKMGYASGSVGVKVVNNFEETVFKQSLTKGTYRLVYHFANRTDKTDKDYMEDSCVYIINVVDTIAPKIDCGKLKSCPTFKANDNCVVPADEVTCLANKDSFLDDVEASDNCSARGDLKLSWRRVFNSGVTTTDAAFTNAYPIGTTTFTWIVTDASGNQATCEQVIVVKDETGPKFDCSTLTDVIAVTDEGQCEASGASVQKAGLKIPEVDDDKCSPTGAKIQATGTRYRYDASSKAWVAEKNAAGDLADIMNDPYYSDTTKIVWVVKDSTGNESSCEQLVIVNDEQEPIFDCSTITDIVYKTTDIKECTAPADKIRYLLGDHSATDNCTTTPIVGVPLLKVQKADATGALTWTTEALPTEYKKDTTYTIVWQFTDEKGNVKECDQLLTIKDTIKPDISEVCDKTPITLTATTECSVSINDANLKTIDQMTITDHCDGPIVPTMVIRLVDRGGTYTRYEKNTKVTPEIDQTVDLKFPVTDKLPHYVLYIYEDKGGNRDTCQSELWVKDGIKPQMLDCQDGSKTTFTVGKDECEADADTVLGLLVTPKAFDECDDEIQGGGQHMIEPTITRYYVDTTCTSKDPKTGECLEFTSDTIPEGDNIIDGKWNVLPFKLGETILKYVFEDHSGNKDSCQLSVVVEDHTAPSFDCSKIDPNPIRPEAEVGQCSMDFGDFLTKYTDGLDYYATDACNENNIKGYLTLDSIGSTLPPDDYKLEAGRTYRLYWHFRDQSGNFMSCRQDIVMSHQNPIEPACETTPLDTVKVTAIAGECVAASSATKDIPVPEAEDVCTKETVLGVPYFITSSDTVKIDLETQQFPTGDTTIHWMFVSPWNLHDTAWCNQVVHVAGNKNFELDCEELTPTLRDTISDCGVTDPTEFVIPTPKTPDPCVTDVDDPNYWRYGEPIRMKQDATTKEWVADPDKKITDGFPLGLTKIKWIFTDFTNSVKDSCIQDIQVRTTKEIDFDCSTLDTIKVDVGQNECKADGSVVVGKFTYPVAKNPCDNTVDIPGTPVRADGLALTDSFYIGITKIYWIFKDETETLAKPIDTCVQIVKVGDVNELPVDCDNFPAISKILSETDCKVKWEDLMTDKVPVVKDLCSGKIIDPTVIRKSDKKSIEYKTVIEGKDTVVSLITTGLEFELGPDTIVWTYDFQGSIFTCEQPISVKTEKKPMGGCEKIDDEITFSAPSGTCEISSDLVVDSLLAKLGDKWPTAIDSCTKKEIPGKVYYKGKEITKGSKVTLPVGRDTVVWIFIDPTINVNGDTCEKVLIIKSDKAPIIDCSTIENKSFQTDECDMTLNKDSIPTPVATDACTGDDVPGVGYRSDDKDVYNDVYPVGKTTITWVFTSPFSTVSDTCYQDVWVRTTKEAEFDCSTLENKPIDLLADPGKCFVTGQALLKTLPTPYPTAKETCSDTDIEGVPYYDGQPLAEVTSIHLLVGDTTYINWKFFNDSLQVNAKWCRQPVVVKSQNAPLFNCDTLQAHNTKFEIAGCDTILDKDALPIPIAIDYCTKDTVPGVGVRSDGKDLYDSYPVGTTTITWTFTSPYSVITVTCDQKVEVLTTQEIDFDCETLDDTVKVSVPDGACKASEVRLKAQYANHPCPSQSGVSTIKGVPSVGSFKVEEEGDEWVIKDVRVGLHTLVWTFTDPSDPATMVNPTKTCEQVLKVGDGLNIDFDCSSLPDTTIKLKPGDCEISWTDMNMQIDLLIDDCTGDELYPTLSRTSGKRIESLGKSQDGKHLVISAENFSVGIDTINWEYSEIGVKCEQVITVKDSMAPAFDCENFKPDTVAIAAAKSDCKAISSAVIDSLINRFPVWPKAVEQCTKDSIPARVLLVRAAGDTIELKKGDAEEIKVGVYPLLWVFIDTTINEIGDTCVKHLTLQSEEEPVFDCSSLENLEFLTKTCERTIETDEIPVPTATDKCVPDTVIPGKGLRYNPTTDAFDLPLAGEYPVGITEIQWTFTSPLSTTPKICTQKIVVLDTTNWYDCTPIAGNPLTLPVDIITEKTDPAAETSLLDTLHANHPCPTESGVEFINGVPSIDGTDLTLNGDGTKWIIPELAVGNYTIVWTFHDKSWTLKDSIKTCEQELTVEDKLDTLYCPSGWNHKTIACIDELPAIYTTFEEFKAAGGHFSNEKNLKTAGCTLTGCFGSEENSIGTKYCNETYYRMYYVYDTRENKISCTDTITIKDTVPPVFLDENNVAAECISKDANGQCIEYQGRKTTISCDQVVPDAQKPSVSDCDPDVTLTVTSNSLQGADPTKCDYYTYDIIREWTATDRCGNVSTMKDTVAVVDTVAPKVELPTDWQDTVLADYLKGCIFLVPDFAEDLRKDGVVSDNCVALDNIIITQIPAPGDTIKETTQIDITISDPCGSDTSIVAWVYAPKRETVVSLDAHDTVICVSDDAPLSLMDNDLRFAEGGYWMEDEEGRYWRQTRTQYDIYKTEVVDDSLFYSNNRASALYQKYFKSLTDDERKSIYELSRKRLSGTYWFVAFDTLTLCSDTAAANLELKERPRIMMDSGLEELCEKTRVDSTLLTAYLKCVNPMGADITNTGWLYGDEKFNFATDTLAYLNGAENKSFVYYAENECGTTTTLTTLAEFCGASMSTDDSLNFAGSDANLALLRTENLYTRDSIMINVHKRYDPDSIWITSEPTDPARIWLGETVELEAHTPYTDFTELVWYRVVGEYDRRDVVQGENEFEFVFDDSEDEQDEAFSTMSYSDKPWLVTEAPEDTTHYYVTITDGVCPSVASELNRIDVILKIPTAFTPYVREGLNDIFMERHQVTIFDRYGQKVFEGSDGWDGTKGGKLADPGVYFYSVIMTDGSQRKGTIEIVYLRD